MRSAVLPYAGRLLARLHLACLSTAMTASGIDTLRAAARYEEVIKKSRFIVNAAPASTSEAAIATVRELSDAKARHNCFAWRLANGETRTNGDGEPGGTAGPPILSAIEGAGLSDVVVVVSRYRLGEGAKLGTGGLVRAYGGTAARCLAGASIVRVEPRVSAVVRYTPEDTGRVFGLLGGFSLAESANEPSSGMLEARFEVAPDELERISGELFRATQGRVVCQPEPSGGDGDAGDGDFFD